MNAQLSSVVALIYVIVGGMAVCLMLELKGRARDRNINSILIFLHRFLGYLFTAIYAVMLYFMIMKISTYQEELSPRVAPISPSFMDFVCGETLIPYWGAFINFNAQVPEILRYQNIDCTET